MKKRAEKVISQNGFNEQSHPALCALVDFAAQNPGLDFANYGTAQTYNEEMRGISEDWRRVKAAVAEAGAEMVTDAAVIAAAPNAFSGRLTWETRRTIGGSSPILSGWSYCTGQYWPTEYRKAAATVLENAIRETRRARPASKGIPASIADLKRLNEKNGGCWFSPGAMRFFGTRIESGILRGKFFITSEQPPHGSRGFCVRSFDDEGGIDTVGEVCQYSSKADAIASLSQQPVTAAA